MSKKKSESVQKRIADRYYRALDYLSIYVFILIVYGAALVTDYLLFALMWALLSDDVKKYRVVAMGFDYARIGLALLFILGALVHGVISTYSQVQLDLKLAKENEYAKS